jgi:HlyD family secretion protein
MVEKIKLHRLIHLILTHKKLSALLLVIVLLLIFFLRPKAATPVDTQTITYGNISQTVSGSGVVGSKTTANLTFPIGGRLTYLGVKKGDSVTAGQTIAALDLRSVQKNLQDDLITYNKQRLVFDATQKANNNHTPQDALSDSMKQALQNNQYDLDKTILSVEIQDLAKLNSILTTPISGIVTRADVDSAGVTVSAATTFSVSDPNNFVFDIDIDEADIGKVVIGQNINISFDSYPDDIVRLTVTSIDFASHATSTGGTAYTVEATLPNQNGKYRIGMNGDADIVIAQQKNVLTLPLSALVNDDSVYVKDGKKYRKVKVTLGLRNDTDAQILSGVGQGDVIASTPSQITDKMIEKN